MEAPPPSATVGGVVADVGPTVLVDVAAILATEPRPEAAFAGVLRRLIPQIADWGIVHILDGTELRRVAVHHRDPAKAPWVAAMEARDPVEPPVDAVLQAVGEGRSLLADAIDDEVLLLNARDPEMFDLWKGLGISSGIAVPMVLDQRVLGTFSLAMGDSGRTYSDADRPVLESVAWQCALLVENTRLVRESAEAGLDRLSLRGLLDTVLANAPVATALLDPWLRVAHANEAFAALGRSTPPECLDRPVVEVAGPLGVQLVPLLTRALDQGAVAGPLELPLVEGPSGCVRYEAHAYPIERPDGRSGGVGLVLVDVTRDRQVAAELREQSTRLALSLEGSGLATWEWDLRSGDVRSSGGLPDHGLRSADTPDPLEGIADRFFDHVHPDDRDRVHEVVQRALDEGSSFVTKLRVVRDDGGQRWLEVRGRATQDTAGRPERMVGVAGDVTDRELLDQFRRELLDREHAARVEAERAHDRLAFLAEAGSHLARSLDPSVVFEQVPQLLVPRFADVCVIDTLDADGSLHPAVVVHRDPSRTPLIAEIRRRRQAAGGDGLWSVRRVVRTGQGEMVDDITDEDYAEVASDADHLAAVRALDARSAIVVPLVSRGRVLGGATFLVTGDRRFAADDLTLAEGLASRLGSAIDNAQLFQSRSRVARALQQSLLPPALPELEHLELAAEYRVARGGLDIGGDFYDAFEADDGSWMVVVGDVCGRGPVAAGVTGLFRHTLRAVAGRNSVPAEALADTNATLLDQIDESRFCTAALLRVRAEPGRAEVAAACGGHPRPVVVRADGTVEVVPTSGALLGVFPDPALVECSVRLGPGDAIVVHTDGVTEARGEDGEFGDERLHGVLERAAQSYATPPSAAALAAAVASAVDLHLGGRPSDDLAVLAVRVRPPARRLEPPSTS